MARKANAALPNRINVIARGTVLEGTLYVTEDTRISGRIVGTVRAGKRVVVAPEGVVDGEIVAVAADVAGRVQGTLDVAEHLVLHCGARVEGAITARTFSVEKGAIFNGRCRMKSDAIPSQAEATPTLAPPQAESAEAPALPDWVDVLAHQKEEDSDQVVLPMQNPALLLRINKPEAHENRARPATADSRPGA